ncbi:MULTISPECIES: hypothetical protein [Catenuloplanes]|uniref:PH domain-containing protein n=1 Tax=Catenuloplanes niger TaxID=587534 RepID=A0AAE4A008_9ACTN|nr:hypothetical protein [Catenuloplanes niger]MDR7327098.1 hypothetical protein [Catenuloplanes niger]
MIKLLTKAVRWEIALWVSLYRLTFRRPMPMEPGAKSFGYVRPVAPVLGVFIVVSAIDIVAIDLALNHFLPNWGWLRVVALVLGVWGLLWMIGLAANLITHRHLVGPSGLRVRNSHTLDLAIPWHTVATVRAHSRYLTESDTVQRAGDVVSIATGSLTAIDVVFREPVTLDLPKGPATGVTELRFHTDTPDELLAHARTFLPDPVTA